MLQWYHIKHPNISILRDFKCVCKGLFLSSYILKSCIRHLSYCFFIAVTRICVVISRVDGALKPWSAIYLGVGNSKQKPGFACSSYVKSASAGGAEEIITMIQRPKWRCSSMLWRMESMTRHNKSHGHTLHPGFAPDVLTLSGQDDSEVDSARLSLTIIQFTARVILISNPHSQQTHICKSFKSPVAMGERRSSR